MKISAATARSNWIGSKGLGEELWQQAARQLTISQAPKENLFFSMRSFVPHREYSILEYISRPSTEDRILSVPRFHFCMVMIFLSRDQPELEENQRRLRVSEPHSLIVLKDALGFRECSWSKDTPYSLGTVVVIRGRRVHSKFKVTSWRILPPRFEYSHDGIISLFIFLLNAL